MRFKGHEFSRANTIGFRNAKEGEKDLYGDPIESNHIVAVRIKDCRLYEKNGRNYYDAKEAPMMANCAGHSRTNMFYGPMKRRKSSWGKWFRGEDGEAKLHYEYFQTTVYLALNGMTWKASIQQPCTPKMEAAFEIQQLRMSGQSCPSFEEAMAIRVKHGEYTQVQAD